MNALDASIRVLIVDDSEDDALLLADELREGGFDLEYVRVDTPEAMSAALMEQPWDIIIADYTMPRFSGPAALQVLHDSGLDIPLILVSGTAEEHTGVDMMRAGAKDFIIKHSLSRLAPAVARELGETDVRRQWTRAEESVKRSALNYRTMFDSAPTAIVVSNRDAVVLQVNPAFEQLFGFSADEVVGRHIWETFGLPGNSKRTRAVAERIFAGEEVRNADYEDVRKDGTPVYVLVNVTPVYGEKGEVTMALSMITDITERKLAEQRQHELEMHKHEFYRRTILAFTEGKLIICEPEEIHRLAGEAIASWNIESTEDISFVRRAVFEISVARGMPESRAYDFTGCVVEAASNALKHAGKGSASLHEASDDLVFLVTDSGPGIEALALPDVALTKGYSTASTLGMGYKVMIAFADKVYLATGPEGTVVAVQMGLRAGRSLEDAVLQRPSGW